jgi:hypothetical protein
MPGELHEQLARAAEEKQVSLNRSVTDVLTATVSPARPQDPPILAPAIEPGLSGAKPSRARALRVPW